MQAVYQHLPKGKLYEAASSPKHNISKFIQGFLEPAYSDILVKYQKIIQDINYNNKQKDPDNLLLNDHIKELGLDKYPFLPKQTNDEKAFAIFVMLGFKALRTEQQTIDFFKLLGFDIEIIRPIDEISSYDERMMYDASTYDNDENQYKFIIDIKVRRIFEIDTSGFYDSNSYYDALTFYDVNDYYDIVIKLLKDYYEAPYVWVREIL